MDTSKFIVAIILIILGISFGVYWFNSDDSSVAKFENAICLKFGMCNAPAFVTMTLKYIGYAIALFILLLGLEALSSSLRYSE